MGGVAWTDEEDQLLKKCVEQFGEGKWHRIPLLAGLNRCRKSCRLRWLNYLRPNIRRGSFTEDEVKVIIKLHKLVGNKWSFIAGRLPGRTANDIKNYWNCHLSKNLSKKDDAGDQLLDNISDIEPQLGNLATRMMTLPSSSSTTPTALEEETAAKAIVAEPSSDQMENREEEEDFRAKNRSLSEVSSYMDHQWEMDYDFAEVKMTTTAAHQDYGNTTTNWEFDDLIFDMDLWVNSV